MSLLAGTTVGSDVVLMLLKHPNVLASKFMQMLNNRETITVRKRANIRNRYNQASHLTQDTNGNVTTLQLDITNEIKSMYHCETKERALVLQIVTLNLLYCVRDYFISGCLSGIRDYKMGFLKTSLTLKLPRKNASDK